MVQEPGEFECKEPGDRERKPFRVKLEVFTDSEGEHHLVVAEKSRCANNPTQKGCMTVPKDIVGDITFFLLGGKDKECHGNGPHDWRLKGVQLSMQAKYGTGTVSDAVKCDFGTDDQGHVLNPSFPGGPFMTIEDRNNEAYEVFYTVSAVSCVTGEEIFTDPWIENKGVSSQ
jgi:hypothetical protein